MFAHLRWDASGRSQSCYLDLFQMMSVLVSTIIFEDCPNQWSVSRPLLGLILLNEKVSMAMGSRH